MYISTIASCQQGTPFRRGQIIDDSDLKWAEKNHTLPIINSLWPTDAITWTNVDVSSIRHLSLQ